MTNTSFFAKSLPSPARALELEALVETVQGIVDTAQQQTEAAVQQALNAQTAAVAAQTAIAGSVGAAAGYADSASGSAINASNSAALADSSKTSAEGSATLAASSAASASVSATNASASATASSGSAAAAAVSATAASGSAINAATSATNAENSASNAAASASSAASNAAAVVSAIGEADLDAFLRKDGGTMLGNLTIQAANPALVLAKDASGGVAYLAGTTGGLPRWRLYLTNGDPETGSDAGSNFILVSRNDANTGWTDRLLINRATGAMKVGGPVQIAGVPFSGLPAASGNGGYTYRITDRNQRWATSDGTNWRWSDGSIAS